MGTLSVCRERRKESAGSRFAIFFGRDLVPGKATVTEGIQLEEPPKSTTLRFTGFSGGSVSAPASSGRGGEAENTSPDPSPDPDHGSPWPALRWKPQLRPHGQTHVFADLQRVLRVTGRGRSARVPGINRVYGHRGQILPPRGPCRPPRKREVEKFREVMGLPDGDARLLEPGFEVFFDRPLRMEANRVRREQDRAPRKHFWGREVGLSLVDPLKP